MRRQAFHVYLHFPGVQVDTSEILRRLDLILNKEDRIMAKQDELEAAVAAETEVGDSVVVLLEQIHQQLKDAQASGDPARIDAVIASLNAKKQAWADAVIKNTDAAPGGGTPPAG